MLKTALGSGRELRSCRDVTCHHNHYHCYWYCCHYCWVVSHLVVLQVPVVLVLPTSRGDSCAGHMLLARVSNISKPTVQNTCASRSGSFEEQRSFNKNPNMMRLGDQSSSRIHVSWWSPALAGAAARQRADTSSSHEAPAQAMKPQLKILGAACCHDC